MSLPDARHNSGVWASAFLAGSGKGITTESRPRRALRPIARACFRCRRLCCLAGDILAGRVDLELETQPFEAGQSVAGHGGVPLVASLSKDFPGERCECLT